MRKTIVAILFLFCVMSTSRGAELAALIVDGQNNHDFKSTTPHLKKLYLGHRASISLWSTEFPCVLFGSV